MSTPASLAAAKPPNNQTDNPRQTMRIQQLAAANLVPLRQVEFVDLSSPVIIAGANGSGKTRLKEAISDTFRSPTSPRVSITIQATRKQESTTWGQNVLEVVQGTAHTALQQYMNTRTRGGTYVGTVIQIDSDRSVQPVKFTPITYSTPDPDDEEISYTYYLSPFTSRWPQLVNKIHQKAANRDKKIASYVRSHPQSPGQAGLDANPDPFIIYQDTFASLLPGKKLEPIDPIQPREFHYRIGKEGPFSFNTLSSGEQEVIKVTFDLVSKRISHSVILLDEPELHLHPTLTFRLIETLKDLGGGTNQLLLFTHSADLISTYYSTGNVYFIDPQTDHPNQARRLSELHTGHTETARLVGAHLGLFAVGKKLVFIEGADASADRLVYHKVAQQCFPEAQFLPVGSVRNINALNNAAEELEKAIFGVDLFMIRDRDGLTDEQVKKFEVNSRFRVLQRRHVENYLLDADVLAEVAQYLYLPEEKADKSAIENALADAAKSCLSRAIVADLKEHTQLSGVIDVPSLNLRDDLDDEQLKRLWIDQIVNAATTLSARFARNEVEQYTAKKSSVLTRALKTGKWQTEFPVKTVRANFANGFWKEDVGRVRQVYIELALKTKPSVLEDIAKIMTHFKSL